jgi:hypothetical protein
MKQKWKYEGRLEEATCTGKLNLRDKIKKDVEKSLVTYR